MTYLNDYIIKVVFLWYDTAYLNDYNTKFVFNSMTLHALVITVKILSTVELFAYFRLSG